MKRIGIMGGTFDPIHNVHLIMAEEARTQFNLDRIIFMPSKRPPHKDWEHITSDEHRKRMIQHAIRNNSYFEFSDLEYKREGVTYTKDTLQYFKTNHPDYQVFFILGGDSLASLESWYMPEYIFKNCHILAANRGKTDSEQIKKWIALYQEKYQANISEIQMPCLQISSELIRNKVKANESIDNYCPKCISDYIRSNNLYGYNKPLFKDKPTKNEILDILSANLGPDRFTHTIGVAVTAANLAMIHGANVKKAYLAGLLHDCAKYFTSSEQLELCEKYGVELSDFEKKIPSLVHGKLGEYFAEHKYLVEDETILSAIRFHTTGRTKMKKLEKIIFLADYIEPGRDMDCSPYPLEQVRKKCYQDLDLALIMTLKNTLSYLELKKLIIDDTTLETYHYYKNKRRN